MSWSHFVRRSRLVKIGGRKLGPWLFGGHVYRIEPISLLRIIQWLAQPHEGLDPAALATAPVEVLRALIPLSVHGGVLPMDLERASPEQVALAAVACAQVTDLDYVLGALFKPAADTADGSHVGIEAAVCAVAQRYGVEPRTVWLWPAAEFTAVLDAEKQLIPPSDKPAEPHALDDDEVDALDAKLAAYGVEVDR